MTRMTAKVDDNPEDLRFKVGAALEYDRPLDLTISGALARVAVESARRDREDSHALIARFVIPNEFQLEELTVPDGTDAQATVTIYE